MILLRAQGRGCLAAVLLAWGILGAAPGHAKNSYPAEPLQVMIPFAPGGALDAVTRPIADAYAKKYGQSWVIENLGGAGGTIATRKVASERPDGYHLLMASNGQVSIAPFVYPNLPYKPDDLAPVIHIADSTAVLYVSTKSPYHTVQDVIAAAKAEPGRISFAQTGNGSISDLALKLLANRTGTTFNVIPYKGAGVAINDIGGGRIPLLFTFVSTAHAPVQAGLMRPLAVASDQRLPSLPDVPTFAELGIAGVVAKLWVGLMAPAKTPKADIDTLSRQVNTLLTDPAIRQRLEPLGLEIQGGTPSAFQQTIDQDTQRWRTLSQTVELSLQ